MSDYPFHPVAFFDKKLRCDPNVSPEQRDGPGKAGYAGITCSYWIHVLGLSAREMISSQKEGYTATDISAPYSGIPWRILSRVCFSQVSASV